MIRQWLSDNPGELALLRACGLDTVAGAFAYAGGEDLSKPGLGLRRRTRLHLADTAGREAVWYLKRYEAPPVSVRLRRWLTGRGGAGPAAVEFESIRRVRAAGVATMAALAVGQEADWLGVRRSYIVVSAVPGEALERCLADYLRRHASDAAAMTAFNAALVQLVAGLHAAGLAHRDLYAAHIFLDETAAGPKLYLIDLARVFRPRWRTFRWRVKDLAQLKHSMPAAWVEPYWDGFLDAYLESSTAMLGGVKCGSCCNLTTPKAAWQAAIERKVAWMGRRNRQQATGNGQQAGRP